MRSFRLPVLVVVAILTLIAVFRISTGRGGGGEEPTLRMEPKNFPPAAEAARQPDHALRAPVESGGRWMVEEGGRELSIVLALDEAVVRDADGMEAVVRLDPPATRDTLGSRLEELQGEGGVFPVAYPEGEERSDVSRLIVTRDLRVQVEDEAADRVAHGNGLSVLDRPEYAPGWVVMSAATPLAALEVQETLRDNRAVESADVLLASRQFTRAAPNDPLYGAQWHLKKTSGSAEGTDVNIESVWDFGGAGTGIRGYGVQIGIVDDGLQTSHPDFVGNIDTVNDWDFNGNDDDPSPGSFNWHGTAVGGVAAARGNNAIGVTGAAPMARLVGLRLIAASPTDHQIANAMNHRNDIIQIKNNSWGPPDGQYRLGAMGSFTRAAFQNSITNGRGGKGTIFVWAAGNGGDDSDNSNYDAYANSIYTIAVGAMNSEGTRSYYSEPGSNVLICAPSNGGSLGITTTDNTGSGGYNSGDYTSTFGGTSSATPLVSGVIALMLEKNPDLGWRDVQEILIRSAAKIDPSHADWRDNGAGFHFNHHYGAGRVDAAAAVAMAEGWENLGPQVTEMFLQSPLNVQIPDNQPAGITRTFEVSGLMMRVEHVTMDVNINHSARGNLDITLTSPSGTVSRLAEQRGDTNANYNYWSFSSVLNWGEDPNGTWTLRIADMTSVGNTAGGQLTAAALRLYGASTEPVNTAPEVAIASPESGLIVGSGSEVEVEVSARDFDAAGDPGVVTRVELLDNGVLAGTLTEPPYSFVISPEDGTSLLTARAYDSEGAVGESAPVVISVGNQRPVVLNAELSHEGQAYADETLEVAEVEATDYEGDELTLSYQWQVSADRLLYQDVEGAVSADVPPSAANSAKMWRCVITASDGQTSSEPYTTPAVNLLDRPVTRIDPGESYDYASGLVLRGTPQPMSRRAILHEFSQGSPAGGSSEWVEMLVLESGSLERWQLVGMGLYTLNFTSGGGWSNIPAGTLIIVYNGNASKDSFLPSDDDDPSDQRMVVSSMDRRFFDTSSHPWLYLSDGGGSISLRDPSGMAVHGLSYGTSTALGAVGSGRAAYYAGEGDAGADDMGNWTVTTALSASTTANPLSGVSPGSPNGPVNGGFVNALRTGTLLVPASFRLGASTVLPAGLSFDEETGRISGTVDSGDPALLGKYPIVIERYNEDGETTSQSFDLTVGPLLGFEGWLAGFPDLEDVGWTGDDDGDGWPNVLEYLFGTDPGVADSRPVELSGDAAAVKLATTQHERDDFRILAEWAAVLDDGDGWSREGITEERTDNGDGTWRVIYTLPVSAEHPRRFMRLVVVPAEETE